MSRLSRAAPISLVLPLLLAGLSSCSDSRTQAASQDCLTPLNPVSVDRAELPNTDWLSGPLRTRLSVGELRRGRLESGTAPPSGKAARLTLADSAVAARDPIDPRVLSTPYWTGIFGRLSAQNAHRRARAINLFYEVSIEGEGGADLGRFSGNPKGWHALPRLEPGSIRPGDLKSLNDYLSAGTVLTGLAMLADSTLLVARGKLRATPYTLVSETSHGDLYLGRELIREGIRLPGELVAYSATSLFFLKHPGGSNPDTTAVDTAALLVEVVCHPRCCPG